LITEFSFAHVHTWFVVHTQTLQVPPSLGLPATALGDAYLAMGCSSTSFTCAPYLLDDHAIEMGDRLAWGESNAVVYANSVRDPNLYIFLFFHVYGVIKSICKLQLEHRTTFLFSSPILMLVPISRCSVRALRNARTI
jgi:hypothetical protein